MGSDGNRKEKICDGRSVVNSTFSFWKNREPGKIFREKFVFLKLVFVSSLFSFP